MSNDKLKKIMFTLAELKKNGWRCVGKAPVVGAHLFYIERNLLSAIPLFFVREEVSRGQLPKNN